MGSKTASLPAIGVTLDHVKAAVVAAKQSTTSGKFEEAVERFREALLFVPMLNVERRQEVEEVCMGFEGVRTFYPKRFTPLFEKRIE